MNKEIRNITTNVDVEGRKVSGYAIRFNEQSADLGFYETILPEAVDEDLILNSDVFALFNHNEDDVLARSHKGKGSLKLELREDGLYYEFEAPNTVKGDELIEHIKRGEILGSSFAFSTPSDYSGESWTKVDDTYYRTIKKISNLYDVSPVYTPAYPTTSCNYRDAEKAKEHYNQISEILDACLDEINELSK